MDVGVAGKRDVLDDGPQVGRVQPMSVDAAADRRQGAQRGRMAHRQRRSVGDAQPLPRRFGEARLARLEQPVRHLIESREHLAALRGQQHLGAGPEAF